MFYMIVTEIHNSQRNYVEIVHKIEPSNNDTINNIIRNIGPVQIQKNEFKCLFCGFLICIVPSAINNILS